MKIYYNQNLARLAREMRNNPTRGEQSAWTFLKQKQMLGFDFHRQKPIGEFIADFYCHELRLVIEIDGATHASPEVQIKDRQKDEFFKTIGLNILRFTDEEVLGEGDLVVSKLKEYINMTHPPTPS